MLRSGDHPGAQGNNLISGDVPDQIKRAGAKGKPKPSNAALNPDFSDEVEVIIPNPNTLTLSTRAWIALVHRLILS